MTASSSSTVDELPPQHQVFISFRGKDLRFGFFSHLVAALKHHNINVFNDDHEDSPSFPISKSRIALIIFSSNYTESVWCLSELTNIKKCMEQGRLVVVPIFYKLEPSTVRDMRGEFGNAFRNLTESDERKKKWEKASKSTLQLLYR